MNTIYVLATPGELASELGKFITLKRVARGWEPADLAEASQLSLEEIQRIESGDGGGLLVFLRIAQALNFAHDFMTLCEPRPATLDEIERIESHLNQTRPELRVRPG